MRAIQPHRSNVKKIPKQGGTSLCVACSKVVAIVHCFSCGVYEPSGIAVYCQQCFDRRHPWYRVDHRYVSIQEDDDVMEVTQRQYVELEVDRTLVEYDQMQEQVDHLVDGVGVLLKEEGRSSLPALRTSLSSSSLVLSSSSSSSLALSSSPTTSSSSTSSPPPPTTSSSPPPTSSSSLPPLVLDVTKERTKLRAMGRLLNASESKLYRLQYDVRTQCLFQEDEMMDHYDHTHTHIHWIIQLQCLIRKMLAKRYVRQKALKMYYKVWDKDIDAFYYVHKGTQDSSRQLPFMLRDVYDQIEERKEEKYSFV